MARCGFYTRRLGVGNAVADDRRAASSVRQSDSHGLYVDHTIIVWLSGMQMQMIEELPAVQIEVVGSEVNSNKRLRVLPATKN